uniref:Uncharacterized protein n=1 Tax=Arundo donax TaxID=35708 RepID=A0A0A8YKL1_ARUDO
MLLEQFIRIDGTKRLAPLKHVTFTM